MVIKALHVVPVAPTTPVTMCSDLPHKIRNMWMSISQLTIQLHNDWSVGKAVYDYKLRETISTFAMKYCIGTLNFRRSVFELLNLLDRCYFLLFIYVHRYRYCSGGRGAVRKKMTKLCYAGLCDTLVLLLSLNFADQGHNSATEVGDLLVILLSNKVLFRGL